MSLPSYTHTDSWQMGPQAPTDQILANPSLAYSHFASPWMSQGIAQGNVNIRQLMDFGSMLYRFDPTFRQAMLRVIGYFLTDIEFSDPSENANLKDEDIKNYQEILQDQIRVKTVLRAALEQLCFLGNCLMSMMPPITRRLVCPQCRIIHPVDVVASPDNKNFEFRFVAKGAQFHAKCQKCGFKGAWQVYNLPADYRRSITVQFWNPKEFILHHDPFTDRRLYTWQIPGDIKKRVNSGDPLLLSSMPLSMLRAIGDNKDYRFNDETILHLREPALVDVKTGGWGVSPAVYSYGMSRYVFTLRKMNEVLASDYMIPVRICTPARTADNGGIATTDTGWVMDMNDWNNQARSVFANHRKDPASIHFLPYPIEYQTLGAEGKNLLPGEIYVQGEDMQLNAAGVPPEMYRGNMAVQVAPVAARMFEQHWQSVPENGNLILSWIVSNIAPVLGWTPCSVRLTPSKIADNMDHLMLLLQMVQSGAVSQSTVLNKLGLKMTEEVRKQMDEARTMARLESENKEELDKIMAGQGALAQIVEQNRMAADPAMQQQGGGAPMAGGAAPAPTGPPVAGGPTGAVQPAADPISAIMGRIQQFANPDVPTPVQDLVAVAEEAAAIFATLPEIQKRDLLSQVKGINPTMKDLITTKMTEYLKSRSNQAVAQDRQMMMQGQ